jgi:hypothetical protein
MRDTTGHFGVHNGLIGQGFRNILSGTFYLRYKADAAEGG